MLGCDRGQVNECAPDADQIQGQVPISASLTGYPEVEPLPRRNHVLSAHNVR